MVNAVTAAERRVACAAKQAVQEASLRIRTPCKPDSRLPVVLVGADAVSDPVRSFLRRGNIFISQPEVESEVGADSPVVFGVEIRLAITVLQKEWSEAFLIVGREIGRASCREGVRLSVGGGASIGGDVDRN